MLLKRLTNFARNLANAVRDDRGGATIEYALVAGLIIIGCIGAITVFGTRALARWNSVNAAGL
jgi:Flp pilus assembly pilin Flp